ncbi:Methylthioribose kinase [Seminavis robusta]|uniref:Methylthioribose kinase n=1 Tax=Seminavis robusta TaxID=568900 RepID=A0A9N8H3F6_9STRA|nr:Methylthioribose kinase [Seminavis robusta]|eukprot:Sro25_g017280.1 Methylthioribose kinase (361) ;mRNA; r:144982-146064
MMEMFAQINPGCAPVPYLCEPVHDMMVLVTEWNDDDEQLATQVIDGWMDPRVASGLARSVANLHCQDFDPSFNTGIRNTMVSTFSTLHKKLESMIASTDNSRASLLARTMGTNLCQELASNMLFHYENTRDCLVHSDLHVKNILVEREAAKDGTVSIVDWEMAFSGPIGRDLGSFFPFLLCCALAHAISGKQEEALNLLNTIDQIWEEYAEALRQRGKSEDFISYAFRSIIGWCGRFMFLGFYTSGNHTEDFPLADADDKPTLMDSIGVLSLRFMQWGFDSKYVNFDLEDLRRIFADSIWNEMALITTIKATQPTTSSNKSSVVSGLEIFTRFIGVKRLPVLQNNFATGRLMSLTNSFMA